MCQTGYAGNKWWYPCEATGFSRKSKDTATFTCDSDNAGPISGKTWVARESYTLFDGYFSYFGAKLDVTQLASDTGKFTIKPDKDKRNPWACGNESSIKESDFIKGVFHPKDKTD